MTRQGFHRRSVLQAMGLWGGSSLFPSLLERSARADVPKVPTRLLLFWAGSGLPRQLANYTSASGGIATPSDYVFPEVRAPLNAYKKDLVALDGLDMVSVTVDKTSFANAHARGEGHSLAATNMANPDTAGGPSIDQYIAQQINKDAPVTKIPSLALASQVDGNVGYLKVCTSGPGQAVSLEPTPANVYKRLFGDYVPMKDPAATGPSEAELRALRKKSVLDLVLNDFASAKTRVSSADGQKLEAHAAAVRDLELRLSLSHGTAPQTSACKDPTQSVLAGSGNAYPGTPAMYNANFSAMSHLVQSAFACDLTRVALLHAGEPYGEDWGYTSGNWGTSDAHDLIHKTSANDSGTLKSNVDAMKAVTKLHQLEAQQFASILDLLRGIEEADGKTLLDHTIVLWCSQIAEHGHGLESLPWVLGGGGAVGLRPGRYLKFEPTNNHGVPHNNLFVSLANAMGVATNTFGNPAICEGPLAGLL